MSKGRRITLIVLAILILSVAAIGYAYFKPPSEGSLARKRQAYVDRQNDLEANIREAILAGDVIVGMTLEQVQASIVTTGFGMADRMELVRSAVGAEGKSIEIWSDYRHWMLGFEGGILRKITALTAGSKKIPAGDR